MRVVVFGGAGFLGSHVADALTRQGHEVVIYDLRPSPFLQSAQQLVVGDLLDRDRVSDVVKGCHAAYHFAGMADIDACRTQPIETVRNNILGTVVALDACAAAGVSRFVFASTVYVYSGSGSYYRASKQSCELYIEEFQRQARLPFTILRYGTLYGRRADRRNSVHRFLHSAIHERKILYYGTGDEIREYIHVADAARCSVDVLSSEYENQHVIITGQQPMRVNDLMTMIGEIVGVPLEIVYAPDEGRELGHYRVTPYLFQPKIARKLSSSYYLDLGQGLLDCLDELMDGAARPIEPEASVGLVLQREAS